MCDPIGWIPEPLKRPMPPGYFLDAWQGMDDPRPAYHWTEYEGGDRDNMPVRFGPNATTRLEAWRQAWRDYRSGGTDPTAAETPRAKDT